MNSTRNKQNEPTTQNNSNLIRNELVHPYTHVETPHTCEKLTENQWSDINFWLSLAFRGLDPAISMISEGDKKNLEKLIKEISDAETSAQMELKSKLWIRLEKIREQLKNKNLAAAYRAECLHLFMDRHQATEKLSASNQGAEILRMSSDGDQVITSFDIVNNRAFSYNLEELPSTLLEKGISTDELKTLKKRNEDLQKQRDAALQQNYGATGTRTGTYEQAQAAKEQKITSIAKLIQLVFDKKWEKRGVIFLFFGSKMPDGIQQLRSIFSENGLDLRKIQFNGKSTNYQTPIELLRENFTEQEVDKLSQEIKAVLQDKINSSNSGRSRFTQGFYKLQAIRFGLHKETYCERFSKWTRGTK